MRGILEFLRIFSVAFKYDEDITLLLVGDGPAKKSIKEFILKKKVSNIVLSDPVPYSKIHKMILACDMGVVLFPDKPAHALYRYQCPTKLIEFLALGKPVIASDLPGIKWIAKDSPSVVFLKLLNESSLREAFDKILTEKKKNAIKTAPFRQKIINRFLSSIIARKLSKIIDSI
jgi:glycosyltransferase involved in cell wall biosynthesis